MDYDMEDNANDGRSARVGAVIPSSMKGNDDTVIKRPSAVSTRRDDLTEGDEVFPPLYMQPCDPEQAISSSIGPPRSYGGMGPTDVAAQLRERASAGGYNRSGWTSVDIDANNAGGSGGGGVPYMSQKPSMAYGGDVPQQQQQQQQQHDGNMGYDRSYTDSYKTGAPAFATREQAEAELRRDPLLKVSPDNILLCQRMYHYVDYRRINAASIFTVLVLVYAAASALVTMIVLVGGADIDLYWYRILTVILGFALAGAGLVVILLHIYRHHDASPEHTSSVQTPIIAFAIGEIWVALAINWYVSSHGTTIHRHSCAEMSALTSAMDWAFVLFMVLIPIAVRALFSHRTPEHMPPQISVELGLLNDQVASRAIHRKASAILQQSTSSGGRGVRPD